VERRLVRPYPRLPISTPSSIVGVELTTFTSGGSFANSSIAPRIAGEMFPLCMPTVTNSGSSPLNRFGHVGPMVNSVVPSGLDIGVSGIRHEFSLICSREPRIRLYRFSTLQAGIEGVTRFRSGERRVTLRTERRVGNQNEIRLVLSNVRVNTPLSAGGSTNPLCSRESLASSK